MPAQRAYQQAWVFRTRFLLMRRVTGLKQNGGGFSVTVDGAERQGRGWSAQPFETSMPGMFAVGDVRHRSVKRVASPVGEGSVVIQQVPRHISEAEGAAAAPAAGRSPARCATGASRNAGSRTRWASTARR